MQKKKGISLIVLVITIIVMIILAAAIILSLNNAGIIGNANKAVSETNLSQLRTLASVGWGMGYSDGARKQSELETAVMEELKSTGMTEEEINQKYSVLVTASEVTVNQSVSEYVDGVPIPNGFVASDIEGENTKEAGLVIYEGTEKVSADEDAKTTRNQFVWVPVEDFSNFVRRLYETGGRTIEITDVPVDNVGSNAIEYEMVVDDENMPVSQLTDEQSRHIDDNMLREAQLMYASVKKHGGFYISRYEASDMNGKAASVQGVLPYTNMQRDIAGGAIDISRAMYVNNDSNKTGVVSSLVYGVQWDAIMDWMKDVDNPYYEGKKFINYSAGMGNFSIVWIENEDGIEFSEIDVKSTGLNDTYKVKNVYDIAGNVQELTMETWKNSRYGLSANLRGGSLYNNSAHESFTRASRRNSYNFTNYFMGFRTALYIK